MAKEQDPFAMKIHVTLVPHGYEIDIEEHGAECRSYGGNINVADAVNHLVEQVRTMEQHAPHPRKRKKKTEN